MLKCSAKAAKAAEEITELWRTWDDAEQRHAACLPVLAQEPTNDIQSDRVAKKTKKSNNSGTPFIQGPAEI